jgi:hypothetical protein
VLHRLVVLWFSPAQDEYMAKSLAWLERNRVEHRRLDLAALRDAYPQIVFRDSESGFLETRSGALVAGRSVRAVVPGAGLEARILNAGPPERDGDAYRLAEGLRARNLVYACGPWLPALFPQVLGGRIAFGWWALGPVTGSSMALPSVAGLRRTCSTPPRRSSRASASHRRASTRTGRSTRFRPARCAQSGAQGHGGHVCGRPRKPRWWGWQDSNARADSVEKVGEPNLPLDLEQ